MKKQKIVITGGAGFIGTNIAEYIVKHNPDWQITVVDDLSAGTSPARLPENVEFIELDIRDTPALTKACDGADVLVHLAALPRVQFSIENPVATHDVNVNGTLSVLEAARKVHARVVFAASSSTYGDQEQLPLTLDLPAQPKSPYALHKYMGELMMKMWHDIHGLETVSLRFFNVYGPHLDPDGPYALVIGRFLKQVKEGSAMTITGDGEQTRDFTHVRDVAAAVMAAATKDTVGAGEVLNIGAGTQTSINELASMIGTETEHIEARLEPRHTMADISKTTELLGWKPTVTLEDGIAELKKEFGLL